MTVIGVGVRFQRRLMGPVLSYWTAKKI